MDRLPYFLGTSAVKATRLETRMQERYSPFDKNLADVSPADLEALKGVAEGWYVEYKSQIVETHSFAKCLSSFANSYGGWLFVGISGDGASCAESFSGIQDSEVDHGVESLRNAAKDLLRPDVFYESRVFPGPIECIGLREGSSILAVHVPEGSDPPYVHNNGRIYRRVGDSSDPKHETDRGTLDLLFERGMRTRSRLEERVMKSPVISEEEEEQPFLHFNILSDPYEIMGHRYNGGFTGFSEIMKGEQVSGKVSFNLPFDNIFSTSDGYVARQTNQNFLMNRLLTRKFSRRCHSFVTVPIQIMFVSDPSWDTYIFGRDFVSNILERRPEDTAYQKILDLNLVFAASMAIVSGHRRLVDQAGVKGPFYIKGSSRECVANGTIH